MTRGLALFVAVLVCGCEEPPPPSPMPEARMARIDDESDRPLEGEIAGAPWRLADARFDTVTRAGRERVDLLFWDHPVERCGLPVERPGTAVWLRFPGRTELETGEHVLDAESGDYEAHYEVPTDDGFVEVHRGLATLRLDEVEARAIRGRARVCFADAARSCVEGTFEASPCWSRVDGRALREPPGLRDEALEPVRRQP